MTGLQHTGRCCVAKPRCMVDPFVQAELVSPCWCGWGTSPVSISVTVALGAGGCAGGMHCGQDTALTRLGLGCCGMALRGAGELGLADRRLRDAVVRPPSYSGLALGRV